MTAFPDMVVRMDGLDVTDYGVVYRWTLSGTNTGPEGTASASASLEIGIGKLTLTA